MIGASLQAAFIDTGLHQIGFSWLRFDSLGVLLKEGGRNAAFFIAFYTIYYRGCSVLPNIENGNAGAIFTLIYCDEILLFIVGNAAVGCVGNCAEQCGR